MTHYYTGRSGDSFTDATLHTTDDCPELDAPVRPIANSSVPADASLCGECGDGNTAAERDAEAMIDMGVCPWCPSDDRYEGDHIGQHASSAHPDKWDAYAGD